MIAVNLNSQIINPAPTTRQPAFIVALRDTDISPYVLGCVDAECGELCVPEMYYTKRGDICEYCEGYAEVAGENDTTRFFLGGNH